MAITPANLKYYLSGGAGNSNPNASLGGAISTTEVGTGLNNLFDDVTGDEASAGDTEFRCIYFKNTDADADGLISAKLWIDTQTSGGDSIEIGLDLAGKNGTADTVADENTAPDPAVTFGAHATKVTGLSLATPLVQNDYQALWIKRIVPSSCASTASDTSSITVEGDTV
jgi:hypothetical protein